MTTENAGRVPNHPYTYPTDPDYGVWSRGVQRVVDALDLDWWPNEAHVAEVVADLGLTNPDDNDQLQAFEDELIAAYED